MQDGQDILGIAQYAQNTRAGRLAHGTSTADETTPGTYLSSTCGIEEANVVEVNGSYHGVVGDGLASFQTHRRLHVDVLKHRLLSLSFR